MRKPEFVTLTGPDDATDIHRMVAIQARAPVEWGILFSPKRQGEGRYPSFAFVHGLAGTGLRLSAHLCGAYAREAFATGGCAALGLFPPGTFSRVQVNGPLQDDIGTSVLAAASTARAAGASRAVLQAPGGFPDDDRVDWLHDASGGRGKLPPSWPEAAPGMALVGYAGGLGPDNVAEHLPTIAAAAGRVPYAIDMETRLRTDDLFDLDACEAVLRAVYGIG